VKGGKGFDDGGGSDQSSLQYLESALLLRTHRRREEREREGGDQRAHEKGKCAIESDRGRRGEESKRGAERGRRMIRSQCRGRTVPTSTFGLHNRKRKDSMEIKKGR